MKKKGFAPLLKFLERNGIITPIQDKKKEAEKREITIGNR